MPAPAVPFHEMDMTRAALAYALSLICIASSCTVSSCTVDPPAGDRLAARAPERRPVAPSVAPSEVEFAEAPAPVLGTATFDCELKGTSETFGGEKFKFTGTGTMTIDEVTGTLTFSFNLSNGLTFGGTGTAAVTEKGRVFGVIDLSQSTTSIAGLSLGGAEGSAVVDGKAKTDGSSFSAKITAGIPNRLGPPPAGFVLSKMSVKGTRQT